MRDNASPKGILNLKIYNKAGELIEDYTQENLIVTAGKVAQTYLLGGGPGWADKKILNVQFGTDGTAPDAADTAITDPFTKAVTPSFPDTSSVLFSFSLGFSEANGKAIQELGLLCVDNSLFSRRTRAVINKDSSLKIDGTWKIQY